MIITASVTPPHESCKDMVVETTGTFSPPPEVIDCPDPYCGRLIHPLRVAAKTKDAKEILARAAVARYRSVHPELTSPEPNSSHVQAALSDLAVTGPVRLRLLPRSRPGRGGYQSAGEVEAGRGLPRPSGRRSRPERCDQEGAGSRLQGGLGAPRACEPPQSGARSSGLDRCHRRGRSAAPAGERRVGALSPVRPDRAGRHHARSPPDSWSRPGSFRTSTRSSSTRCLRRPRRAPGRPRILRSARSHPSPETSFSSSTATARRPKRRCRWSVRSSSRPRTEDGR